MELKLGIRGCGLGTCCGCCGSALPAGSTATDLLLLRPITPTTIVIKISAPPAPARTSGSQPVETFGRGGGGGGNAVSSSGSSQGCRSSITRRVVGGVAALCAATGAGGGSVGVSPVPYTSIGDAGRVDGAMGTA